MTGRARVNRVRQIADVLIEFFTDGAESWDDLDEDAQAYFLEAAQAVEALDA